MNEVKKYKYNGKYYTLKELQKISNINYGSLWHRINQYGWSIEKAVETPAGRKAYRTDKINHNPKLNISEEEKAYWNNLVLDDEYKNKFINAPIIGDILRI